MALINVVGDDLHFWYPDMGSVQLASFVASGAQVYDDGTIERLQRLSIAVIGCSGTGSPTVEQLFRLGAGELVTVDDDHMEDRNVNRIPNSTMQDVRDTRLKVNVLADAHRARRPGHAGDQDCKEPVGPRRYPPSRPVRHRLWLYGYS